MYCEEDLQKLTCGVCNWISNTINSRPATCCSQKEFDEWFATSNWCNEYQCTTHVNHPACVRFNGHG